MAFKSMIKKNLRGKRIIILFILTNVVYAAMLTITIPRVMAFAGGMKLLDMMPTGYNSDYVDSLMLALGEKGRSAYLLNQLPLDMVYPLLFGVTYCLVLAYILNRLGKLDGYLFYLCLMPLVAGSFDYCENIGIISILSSYPNNPPTLSGITNVFSILKSACTTIHFTVLTIALIWWAINGFFSRNASPPVQ